MKIDTSKVKKGTILKIDNGLHRVVDMSHNHTGRGGAVDTYKIKDVVSGKTTTATFHAGATLEQADISTVNAVFLYKAGDNYSFMENDSGEMHDLSGEEVGEDIVGYLKENMDLFLTIYEGRVLGVILPATVSYKILSTVPGVKGDRAQAGKKPATIETGIEVMVPLHRNEGDTVTVNTLTGDIA